jgi:hypothetical protein
MVCVGGPDYRILLNGRAYTFEWHSYFGPAALNQRGDPLARQPHAFLKAATLWNQQGRHVDEDGWCSLVWKPLTKIQYVTRRQAVVLAPDAPEWDDMVEL